MRLVIEEHAGEHEGLVGKLHRPKYCECGGDAVAGSDSCLYCGKYVRGLFTPIVRDDSFRHWERFVRERPYAESELRAA